MRAIWLIMGKDLLRRWRAPLAPLVFLAFPFLFAGLIAITFGGGGEEAIRFPLALVDEDQGVVAGLLRGAFGRPEMARFLEVQETTRAEAEHLIERNRVAGALIIPAGFSDALLAHEPAQLEVLRNPAASIGPVAIEETAELVAVLLSGAAQVLRAPFERMRGLIGEEAEASAWAADDAVAEVAVLVNRSLRGMRQFVFPPALRLVRTPRPSGPVPAPIAEEEAAEGAEEGTTTGRIFQAVLPGMATFALFVLVIGLTADLFREKHLRTLARQLVAPVRARTVVWGKVLATLVVGLCVAGLMALVGAVLLGARADLGAFALLSLAYLLSVTGLITFLYSLARDERQGGTITSIVMMVMAFLGGSFLPLAWLPAFVRQLAPLTLNYWGIQGFQALLLEGAGLAEILQPLLVLLGVGLSTVLAGSGVLERRLMRGA